MSACRHLHRWMARAHSNAHTIVWNGFSCFCLIFGLLPFFAYQNWHIKIFAVLFFCHCFFSCWPCSRFGYIFALEFGCCWQHQGFLWDKVHWNPVPNSISTTKSNILFLYLSLVYMRENYSICLSNPRGRWSIEQHLLINSIPVVKGRADQNWLWIFVFSLPHLPFTLTHFLFLSSPKCVYFVAFNSNQARFVSTSRDDGLSADVTGCDPSDRYAIIVHGWSESCSTSWAEELRKSELHFRTFRIRLNKICSFSYICKEHFSNEKKASVRRRKSIVSCVCGKRFSKNLISLCSTCVPVLKFVCVENF